MNKIILLVLAPLALSAGNVAHNGRNFIVMESDRTHIVKGESLDSTLKNVNARNMQEFLRKGRISAHKTNDGSYVLRGHVNGLGGGPVAAAWAYWITKSTMYGTAIAAGTVAVATGVGAVVVAAGGGVALAAATGGGAAFLAETATGVGAAVAVSAGASATGAGFVAATVGGASLAGGATSATILAGTYATTAGVATATVGTSLGTVGFVEGCAIAAAAFFGAMPFLP